MRDNTIEAYDHIDRPVIAIGNEFAPGHVVLPHSHRRCQLLYGPTGVLTVATDHGAWVVPRQSCLWLPSGVTHEVRSSGLLHTRSLFFEPAAVADMPRQCQVLGVTPLMRSLLMEAIWLPLEYERETRDGLVMALILEELRRLPVQPLSLPLPAAATLSALCRGFVARPTAHDTIDAWCGQLGMSRRAFTRHFKLQTGMTFAEWRQRACLLSAVPRLSDGEAVTTVALDLGYDSPAAFTTMFKRALGEPPSRYFA
ncbi:AraC family transcriptional regulator [Phenylobacterium montanum]|uniref:Helix-turn-helix transcriptional regulator n=1 Tax=Phenylobacterium montanum TaxID=2823693 RepID=A0A975G2T9_9CAUL|nr:helix-turn-helix transcriptional regulator [Caulobacter sp. S6]QUD89749.1 helix-turn-helix transcriptional regulator [Caulobacter sp. S6]